MKKGYCYSCRRALSVGRLLVCAADTIVLSFQHGVALVPMGGLICYHCAASAESWGYGCLK